MVVVVVVVAVACTNVSSSSRYWSSRGSGSGSRMQGRPHVRCAYLLSFCLCLHPFAPVQWKERTHTGPPWNCPYTSVMRKQSPVACHRLISAAACCLKLSGIWLAFLRASDGSRRSKSVALAGPRAAARWLGQPVALSQMRVSLNLRSVD